MRAVPAAIQAYREARRPIVCRELVWVTARNASGALEQAGFWTGRADQAIQVVDPDTGATVTRTYAGAGSLMEVAAVTHSSGLDIVPLRVTLSAIDDAVEEAVRGYSVRLAPVQVHRLWLDYDTRLPLAPAQVWTVGQIDGAPITTPAAGGEAQLVFTIVPRTRALTVGNPDLLSDAVQSRRGGDRFLRYVVGTPAREIPWGRK